MRLILVQCINTKRVHTYITVLYVIISKIPLQFGIKKIDAHGLDLAIELSRSFFLLAFSPTSAIVLRGRRRGAFHRRLFCSLANNATITSQSYHGESKGVSFDCFNGNYIVENRGIDR